MTGTRSMVQKILEGSSPRDVISSAVAEAAEGMSEAATITKKVVRNGKIVKKKFKKFHKKRILSAAQKRAIRKAQTASKKGTAVAKRKKSLKKARTFEGAEDVDAADQQNVEIVCPDCGSHNVQVLYDEENDTSVFYCPDCDADFSLVNDDTLADLIPPEDADDDSEVDIDIADDDKDDSDDADASDGSAVDDSTPADESCSTDSEKLYYSDDDDE